MMNKKSFLILALVALLALPTVAMAAAEFSLGGYIKLDVFWDSTQEGKNMNQVIQRNNTVDFHHGRLKFTSQSSRFNFTIKGPKLWGATTTGFIEIDFDQQGDVTAGTNAAGASNGYLPRLRNAFFRFDWPETELLMGQYFTFVSKWFPELAQDGPFQITGTPTARMAMIKVVQKFMGMFEVGLMVGEPNAITNGRSFSANDRGGAESTESPQVQAHVLFAKDLYGKAAWYGKPTPFTAEVNFAWQRGITADAARGLLATGQNTFTAFAGFTRNQYHDPWMVQGVLFIPVIPTHSANLAGTAALQTTWWIGQGVEAFGLIGFNSQVFRFAGQNANGNLFFDTTLMSRFGGQVQGQYYFTNQWFMTAAYGMSRAFNVGAFERENNNVPNNRVNVFQGDAVNLHQEFALCLWYRPITAFKFGLQYAYARTDFFQKAGVVNAAGDLVGSAKTNLGEAHRVEFVGLFFF
ncbi:MAG: hypothetical protein C4567_06860 [Deltaproteobacteria bacterium]|nr:MAG: hypothetical protein C4567_06860 [Deltaproteobacteria bacterium]